MVYLSVLSSVIAYTAVEICIGIHKASYTICFISTIYVLKTVTFHLLSLLLPNLGSNVAEKVKIIKIPF